MAEIMAVVPSEGIEDTGEISFRYLVKAEVPRAIAGRAFGLIMRAPKEENYLNPARLVRGEPGAIGDDGTPLWHVALYHGGGPVFSGSVESVAGESGLQDLLATVPECTALVPPSDIEPMRLACEAIGHVLTIHPFSGRLTTS